MENMFNDGLRVIVHSNKCRASVIMVWAVPALTQKNWLQLHHWHRPPARERKKYVQKGPGEFLPGHGPQDPIASPGKTSFDVIAHVFYH